MFNVCKLVILLIFMVTFTLSFESSNLILFLNYTFVDRFSCSSHIVDVIRYVDIKSPSLVYIYDMFDSMLKQIEQAIHKKDPPLGL